MELELILEILQTVGICGEALLLVVITLFILGIGGDLNEIILLLQGRMLLPFEEIEEIEVPPEPKRSRRKKR